MGKQYWSQAVLESGSWGHSVLQTPALVYALSGVKKQQTFLRDLQWKIEVKTMIRNRHNPRSFFCRGLNKQFV